METETDTRKRDFRFFFLWKCFRNVYKYIYIYICIYLRNEFPMRFREFPRDSDSKTFPKRETDPQPSFNAT